MAKKSRTPPPPRRVQAPRARTGARDTGEGRRKLLVVGGIAVAVAAAAALGVALLAFGGSSSVGALEDAGCTVQDEIPVEYTQVEGGEARHLDVLPEDYEYPTDPPVAGTHHNAWAPLGVYDQPIEQHRLVHNTEHGSVVIQYGDEVPEADVNAIVEWYREDPNGLLVAPLPRLGDQVSLGAWTADFDARGTRVTSESGVLAKCPGFDEEAFDAFVSEYGFRGPERFPRDQLPPGS